MTKKILSIVLAVSMVLTMCLGILPVSAAEGAVTISGGDENNLVTGNAGDTITVPINISGNTEGITNYGIRVKYDDTYLTAVGAAAGEVMPQWAFFVPNLNYKYPDSDEVAVSVASTGVGDLVNNIYTYTGDGVLFTCTFQVKEDVQGPVKTALELDVYNLQYLVETETDVNTYDREVKEVKNASVAINPEVELSLSNLTTTYNGQPQGVTVSPSDLAVEVTYNGSTTVPTDAGSYAVTATVTEPGFTGNATGTFVINKEQIKVTADDKTKRVGDKDPDLTYKKTSGTFYGQDNFTGALTREAGETAGSYKITKGTLAVPSNYELIFTEGTLTIVDKEVQDVTVPALPDNVTYGDAAFSWACTPDAESGLSDVKYTSSNPAVATIDNTGLVTVVGAGTTELSVSIAGDDTYADFSETVTLSVAPFAVTVTAENKTKRVGTEDPALTYTYVPTELVGDDAFTGALDREDGETVGRYAINQGTLTLGNNYDITFVPGTLEITEKTPQNIVVADFGAKTYGDAPFTIEVTPDPTSNLENFSYASSDESVATVSEDGTVTILGATDEEGITITVTEAGNDEYAQTSIEKTLVVAKAPLEITLTGKTITYGEELGEFEITYDGFVNEETEADLLTPVEISGVPEDVNAGTYPLTLEGATSNNYEITYVGADLVVNPRAVEIATIGVFNKEADETTDAVINPSTITMTEGKGFLAGDDAFVNIVSYTAAFEDAEAGVDKAVTLSDVVAEVTGNDKNNYTISVADSALATTATIYAAGEMTAQDVADQIGGYIPVTADDETLILPEVPEGFTIAINTSSNEEVIDPATGAIRHTDKDEEVKLTFTVTKESDSSTATTGEITVTVPKGTNKTVSIAVNGNGTLEGDIGSQPIGSEITIIAVPDDGYQVSEWFVNGESIGRAGQTSYTFVLEDDITIGVAFTKRPGGLPSTGTGSFTSVKAPTASVRSGSTVFKGSVIELSTTTSGASIYYTTDGSTPTTSNGTLYTVDGIRISGDVTIKAFATKDSKSSTVATFSYTMKTANAEFKEDANTIKYMESVSDTLFEPDRDATRYEVLEALDALMDIEDANIENGFSDVTEEYEELVNKFAATDIVDGYPNLTFGGTSSITRAEFVKMLAEALNLDMSGAAEHNFNDVQAGHWAESYIAAFTELGYIIGDPDGNFRPDDNITRAEVVTVINRILDVESDPDAEQKYTDLAPEHWAYGYVMAVAKDKE